MINPIQFLKNKFSKRGIEISDIAGGAVNPFVLGGMGLQNSRIFADWFVSNMTEDASIRWTQQQLRAYSRDLVRTSVFVKRYKSILANQIIGDSGIALHINARETDGTPDDLANTMIENVWASWCEKGNCTIDGELSFRNVEKLIVQTMAIDGEIFIRKFNSGDFDFQLQLLEADYCPVSHNGRIGENKVINGIEYDSNSKPIAYWMYGEHPGAMPDTTKAGDLKRIPADEIIHLYFKERPQQGRGIPWTAPGIPYLRILDRYTNAELAAAWASSCLMGTIETQTATPAPPAPLQGTTKIPDTKMKGMEIGPMSINQLPAGKTMKWNTPQHPVTQYDAFQKAILRGVAAAWNISYNTLVLDLESTSYSSMRQGTLDERDFYKNVQNYLIENFLAVIFPPWLRQQILNGNLNLPISKFYKFNTPQWHPHRWSWVDPAKDMQAIQLGLELGLMSRTQVCAEQGREFEDVIQQIATEQQLIEKYNVQLPASTPTKQLPPPDEQDQEQKLLQ